MMQPNSSSSNFLTHPDLQRSTHAMTAGHARSMLGAHAVKAAEAALAEPCRLPGLCRLLNLAVNIRHLLSDEDREGKWLFTVQVLLLDLDRAAVQQFSERNRPVI